LRCFLATHNADRATIATSNLELVQIQSINIMHTFFDGRQREFEQPAKALSHASGSYVTLINQVWENSHIEQNILLSDEHFLISSQSQPQFSVCSLHDVQLVQDRRFDAPRGKKSVRYSYRNLGTFGGCNINQMEPCYASSNSDDSSDHKEVRGGEPMFTTILF